MPPPPLSGRDDRELAEDATQLPLAEAERLDDLRIELRAVLGEDLVGRMLPIEGAPIRAVAGHRVERIGQREDAGTQRDFLTFEPARVSAAVPTLVVRPDDLHTFALQEPDPGQNLYADRGMQFDQAAFVRVERTRFVQHRIRDPDLAHVVQKEAVFETRIVEQPWGQDLRERQRVVLNALSVQTGPRVLGFERIGSAATVWR